MPDTTSIDPNLLTAWKHHEDIAMHFNDLIMRVRTRALGAVAAIIAASGVALKFAVVDEGVLPWGVIAVVLGVLLTFWIAIWILDFLYYNRLLLGAVDATLKLEGEINRGDKVEILMSRKIEDAVLRKNFTHLEKGTLLGPILFYVIVSVILLAGILISLILHICVSGAP